MTQVTDFPNMTRLLWVMERLRDPQTGCPWDNKQTFATIVPHTIEEAYEVADAIETGNMDDIREELGDLLFQVVFYAQMGKEQQAFDFEAVAGVIVEKLIRRHPHVFGEDDISTDEELHARWEQIKQQERQEKGLNDDDSILANLPKGLSPLVKANKLQKKCAKVGFDWQDAAPVVDKIREEIDEVMAEVGEPDPDQSAIEEEIGDLLFAVVNLARHVNVNPESALRKANNKFETRFRQVEALVKAQRGTLEESTLEEMERYWQQVKLRV